MIICFSPMPTETKIKDYLRKWMFGSTAVHRAPVFILAVFPDQFCISASCAGRLIHFYTGVQGNISLYSALRYYHPNLRDRTYEWGSSIIHWIQQLSKYELLWKRLSEGSAPHPMFVFPIGIPAIWRCISPTTYFTHVVRSYRFDTSNIEYLSLSPHYHSIRIVKIPFSA